MRQENCVPHITCLFIACVRSMRTLTGYTHYIHQLNYRRAVGHILKVKYLTDVLSSLRKYILCLAFLLTVSKWKVPRDGETQKPVGVHGRHGCCWWWWHHQIAFTAICFVVTGS